MKVTEEGMYHIFGRNKQFFIVDSYNQLFWNIGTDLQQTEIVKHLIKFGFFTQRTPIEKRNDVCVDKSIHNLVINPSTECNLDCWYCYSREFRSKNVDYLEFEDIKSVIKIILDYNKKLNLESHLMISLGYSQEITMNFGLFLKIKDYIDEINQRFENQINLFLPSTNLVEINNEFVNFVNQYGYLTVSLDMENENQKLAIIDNLKLFNQEVIKHLIIPIKANSENLLGIYRKYGSLFDFVSMRPARVKNDSKFPWDDESVKIIMTELSKLFQTLLEKNDEEILEFLLRLGPTDYIGRFLEKVLTRTKSVERCPAGKTAFALSPTLEIYPCSGMMGNSELMIGKIAVKNDTLEVNSELITSVSNIDNCLQCSIRYYCGGPCLDWLHKYLGDLQRTVNPFECQLNIHLFEEVVNFLYQLLENKPKAFNEYVEKKGLKNALTYPLNFDDFSRVFDFMIDEKND